jgi:hypothetical protein
MIWENTFPVFVAENVLLFCIEAKQNGEERFSD